MCTAVSLALVAQVNPHVAPFYAHLRGRPGRPSGGRARTGAWRGGFLLGALEVSIKEDLRKQLRTLQARARMQHVHGYIMSCVSSCTPAGVVPAGMPPSHTVAGVAA